METLDFAKVAAKLRELEAKYGEQKIFKKFVEHCPKIAARLEAPLTVMVMGEFSTGKSTLINALVGQEIAAVNATPTTAVITVLTYGEKDKVLVHYNNGFTNEFDAQEFAHITAMSSNAQFNNLHKTIKYVERFMPIDILKNMTVIDSPGLNDTDSEHVATTKDFTDNADAVLWVTSMEQAGKRSEVDSMKMLDSRLKPILIVNKIDMIDEEEEDPEEILAKLSQKFANVVQTTIGVSAKMALAAKKNGNDAMLKESRFTDLILYLKMFVLPNRYQIKLNTLFDELGYLFYVEYDTIKHLKKYYLAGEKIDKSEYKNQVANMEKFESSIAVIFDLLSVVVNQSCDNKMPSALYFKGEMFRHGIGVIESQAQAKKYLLKAKEIGHIKARYELANIYADEEQYNSAVECVEEIAKVGDLQAMRDFGAMTLAIDEGKGIEYLQAIEMNDFWVKWILGYAYLFSEDDNVRNEKKAFRLLEEAVSGGELQGKITLALCYFWGTGVQEDQKYAFKLFSESVEETGCCEAAYWLGRIYEEGCGIVADSTKAFYWYSIASEMGDVDAMVKCGLYYLQDDANRMADYNKAVNLFREAAKKGNMDGQNMLGRCYVEGWGVAVDTQKALQCFQKASDSGDVNAMNNLAGYYEEGISVEKDINKAFELRDKAAEGGNASAYCSLGLMYLRGEGISKDSLKAIKWLQKAAEENGEYAAYGAIGDTVFEGDGVEKNEYSGFRWYLLGAEKGDDYCQYRVAEIYTDNSVVEENPQEAFKWNKLAADQGYANAENKLGLMYQNGYGINEDENEAVKWYRKASDHGNSWGDYNLAFCYLNGTGIQKNTETAYKLFCKAADVGISAAQYMVGRCLEEGWGTCTDYQKAFEWYQYAANNGDPAAKRNLAMCYMYGTGVQQNWDYGYSLMQQLANNGDEDAQKILSDINAQATESQSNSNNSSGSSDGGHTGTGALIGGGIGMAVGGPIGAAIGAAIGGWLGSSDKKK